MLERDHQKGLLEPLHDATVGIFSMRFRVNLDDILLTANPDDSLGNLLSQAIAVTAAEEVFQAIDPIEAFRVNHPQTQKYSPLCKKALELEIVINAPKQTL